MAVIELASGRILFREGDASRHIYRVVSGEVEVSRGTGDRAAVLERVGPGHFVGDMGALLVFNHAALAKLRAKKRIARPVMTSSLASEASNVRAHAHVSS